MIKYQYMQCSALQDDEALAVQTPEEFLAGLAEDFAALCAGPIAWAEELAEREAWGVIFPRKIDEH